MASEPAHFSLGTYQDQYVVATNSPVIVKTAPSCDIYADNCVLYAKCRTERLNESWGIAKNITPSQDKPYLGGVVLTNEGPFGHTGYIVDIKDGKLYIEEANYIPGQVSIRSLDIDSPVIRGYK